MNIYYKTKRYKEWEYLGMFLSKEIILLSNILLSFFCLYLCYLTPNKLQGAIVALLLSIIIGVVVWFMYQNYLWVTSEVYFK